MDLDTRDAERLWRKTPDDEAAFERAVQAYRRANLDLPFDLIVRLPRWRPLGVFVRDWFGRAIEERDGVSLDELKNLELAVGRELPVAFREWLRLVGHRQGLAPDRRLLGVRGRWHLGVLVDSDIGLLGPRWGIAFTDFQREDPPVERNVRPGSEAPLWSPGIKTVSQFALAWAYNRRFSRDEASSVFRLQVDALVPDPRRIVAGVVARYSAITVPTLVLPRGQSRYVGDDETLLLVHGDTGIWVAAKTSAAWDRVNAVVLAEAGAWAGDVFEDYEGGWV